MELDPKLLIGGTAIMLLTYAATAWGKVREYAGKFISLFIVPIDVDHAYLASAVVYNFYKKYRDATHSLQLTDEVATIFPEIEFWIESRKWYVERNIPWKRGYLLEGPPGTGKTSLIRAIGQKYNMPIFIFNLATLDNAQLSRHWRNKVSEDRRRIFVIEDIDGVFHGRKNISQTDMHQGVSFDTLLQLMDGVEEMDGTLIFITTNNPQHLDQALAGGGKEVTRPGRIDRVIHLGFLHEDGRRNMAKKIFDGVHVPNSRIEELIEQNQQVTPAQFQEVCILEAYPLWWKKLHDLPEKRN